MLPNWGFKGLQDPKNTSMNLMHWTSPKGGKVYAGFHIELEGIKKFTCQKGLSNVTLTLRLRFFCRLLFQLMFSLSLASLSIFIVKSFFNHAYALVFISLWSCAMQARIPDRGNGDFLQFWSWWKIRESATHHHSGTLPCPLYFDANYHTHKPFALLVCVNFCRACIWAVISVFPCFSHCIQTVIEVMIIHCYY